MHSATLSVELYELVDKIKKHRNESCKLSLVMSIGNNLHINVQRIVEWIVQFVHLTDLVEYNIVVNLTAKEYIEQLSSWK